MNEKQQKLLVFETTLERAKKISEDFQSGELQALLGVKVEDAGIIPESYVRELQELQDAPATAVALEIKFKEVWHNFKEGTLRTISDLKQDWENISTLSLNFGIRGPQLVPITLGDDYISMRGGFLGTNEITFAEVVQLKETALEDREKLDEIVEFLANNVDRGADIKTDWEIALSLGELKPGHPQAAAALYKKVEIEDETTTYQLKLLVAFKPNQQDSENIFDFLFRISMSHPSQTLPKGFKLSVMDEEGEEFLAKELEDLGSQEQDNKELDSLMVLISEEKSKELTAKISLGDVFDTFDFEV